MNKQDYTMTEDEIATEEARMEKILDAGYNVVSKKTGAIKNKQPLSYNQARKMLNDLNSWVGGAYEILPI